MPTTVSDAKKKMTLAEQLAAFVVRVRYEDISADARQQLKIHTLDAIGCAIGALEAPPVKALHAQLDEFGGKPLSSLIGGGKSSPVLAAFYNSTLERYLDFMDSYIAKHETCHPADNVMSILAASEYAGKSGKDFLTALAVAYQVQCRLSDVAPVRPKGFDHTVQGAYGVAAGVAKVLGLDQAGVANAVAISGASYVALRVTRSGNLSNWKGLAYPNMAYGATSAAFLAKRGVTGPLEVFEGKGGLMDAITGKFELDWSKEDLEIVLKTNIKKYNAEFHAQTAMEAALELRSTQHVKASDIKTVSVDIFDVAYNIIGGGNDGNKQHVQTKEEADHSLPYMIAVALIDGEVTPAQYDPKRILKQDVQDLLQKVTIRPDKSMSDRFPVEMPCRIQVELNDGKKLTIEKHDYEGFYTHPMPWDTVVAKFNSLASSHASADQRAAIVNAVAHLDTQEAVSLSKVINVAFEEALAHA
ncbi:2-methylcitrate dehydratase [Silvibacterium bohemicum]|uniref:2-methylcitrate dehydratase n=1 Tax=Silvibacterium bohemicum TaxID=1577686 RepID=A0A841K0V4_9BACT|nr:MmgE/PrpD family protein [Silvibacterium bohemicum]MBB6143874.1 2-methylcitrate dehydratase [Silvibacterium bohemicum]